ncbi:MAG: TldD/PmbA family protein [Bacteroidales bacterium]|nr:TldD/PmbA family protein [Bacteroidales bacterium]
MEKEFHKIAQVLDLCRCNGAEQASAMLSSSVSNTVSIFNSKIDKLEHAGGSSISLRIFADGRFGSFSTNQIDDEKALADFIAKAVQLTKVIEKDPSRKLPSADLYYKGESGELGLVDNSFFTLDPRKGCETAIKACTEIEENAPEGVLQAAESDWTDAYDLTIYADTNGFTGVEESTEFTLSASCSLIDKDGSLPQSWWMDSSIRLDALKAEGCGKKALERGLRGLGPRKIESGRYNVVVENTCSSRLAIPLVSALYGNSIQQKDSFLIDSLGKKMVGSNVTFRDEPHIYGAIGARWFDAEGIATKTAEIISGGVVNQYFLNTCTAAKLNMKPTVGTPSILTMKPAGGATDLDSVLKIAGRGVFITSFHGGNYNHVTGDFSYGFQGFYFENGEIVHPVSETNVTGNYLELWNNLIAAGTDPLLYSPGRIPTLAFEGLHLSGN